MKKAAYIGVVIALIVFGFAFRQPLLIQTQQPNLENLILDVLSFDPELYNCFTKAKNAVPPKAKYITSASLFNKPITLNVTRWGKYFRYGSGHTGLGFTRTNRCDNHQMMDWKRGTSGLATLTYESEGSDIIIGTMEISAYQSTPKMNQEADNYDGQFKAFASSLKLEVNSNDELILNLIFEPGTFQLSGVNGSKEILSYFSPRFVSSNQGKTWRFESKRY